MSKKLIYLVCFVLVLSIAGNASAELVGHWRFDEGSGTTAYDMSAYGNEGTLQSDPQWVNGKLAMALQFDGVDDFVEVPHAEILTVDNEVTVMAWINTSRHGGPGTEGYQGIVAKGNSTRSYSLYTQSAGTLHFSTTSAGAYVGSSSSAQVPLNEWVHVCAMVVGGQHVYYINGEPAGTGGSGINLPGAADTDNVVIGRTQEGATRSFLGMIDDVRIYNHALTQGEIQVIMLGEGYPIASAPTPADGALLTDTWVSLGWRAGDFAVSHDVYLGENFDDVNDGTADTFRGNQDSTMFIVGFFGFPYPDGLVPGTTYYWRIDEVNDTDPNSPWKGDLWSFTVPPRIAYNPIPGDGAKFIDTDVELSWTAGFGAKLHYVYFGDNFDDVNSADMAFPQADTTYTPGTLEVEKTYYWRVDESDGITMQKGDVWRFKTLPDVPITDPNLVGWWKLDEGMGTTAVDWSGHGNHGTLNGNPQWVVGYDGSALEFDGDDHVDTGYTENLANYTITAWVISPAAPSGAAPSGPLHREQNYQFNWNHGDEVFRGGAAMNVGGTWHAASYMPLEADTWYHLAATYDGSVFNAYRNGVLITSNPAPSGPPDAESGTLKLGRHATAVQYFTGTVDDARVYNKALTLEEIQQTMRGDPLLAGNLNPTNGSTPYIREATPLSWLPGENASQHDVYFGIDRDAVADANASDTTGVYRGRQVGTSYTPPDVEWGGGPYYWRIDEYNTDATISEGRIWSFTVTDFIVIDDFEDYNDYEPDRIFDTWIDGWEVPTNGSMAGHAEPPFAETTIVHGGGQSMPLYYENNFKYSEAAMTLVSARNWTEEGVGVLSLWFRGNPAGFVEDPVGTYTMSAAGTDIWGTADEFRYAYKQLSGDGSITATVESVLWVPGSDDWTKAGVMIRDTLDAGSKNAFVALTTGSGDGATFQWRPIAGGDSSSNRTLVGISPPSAIRLVRQGNTFTGYVFLNGQWQQEGQSATVAMADPVYIGLALTSHSSGVTTEAEFSDVLTTGAVTPLTWTHEAIGAAMAANDPEPMYVALNGGTAVYHDNPNAALIDTWTEWTIDLQEFTGVNLANVNTLAIGFGDKNNLQPGGSGLVFFDDIRLYRPAPLEPEPAP